MLYEKLCTLLDCVNFSSDPTRPDRFPTQTYLMQHAGGVTWQKTNLGFDLNCGINANVEFDLLISICMFMSICMPNSICMFSFVLLVCL